MAWTGYSPLTPPVIFMVFPHPDALKIRSWRPFGAVALAIAGISLAIASPAAAQRAGDRTRGLQPPLRPLSPTSSAEFPALLPPNTARPGWSHSVNCRNYAGNSVDGVVDGSRVDILNCNQPDGDRTGIGGAGQSVVQPNVPRAIPASVGVSADVSPINPLPTNPLLLRCEAPEASRVRFNEQPDDSAQARDFCGVQVYF